MGLIAGSFSTGSRRPSTLIPNAANSSFQLLGVGKKDEDSNKTLLKMRKHSFLYPDHRCRCDVHLIKLGVMAIGNVKSHEHDLLEKYIFDSTLL